MLRIQTILSSLFIGAAAVVVLTGLPRAFAGDQVGTLTQIEGEVKLFSNPSKTLPKDDGDARPRALFEGEYYRVHDAKVGDRVDQGNILRTALSGKTRVVFDNGDQFHVGPGTSYRVFWDKDSSSGNTKVNLVYGKLRGIIAKGGPRSRLQIKTKAATMGVRGTEFFIAENGRDGETEISIIRGAVEVKSAAAKPAEKPVELKTGYSATIAAPAPAPKALPSPAATTETQPKTAPVVEIAKVSPVIEIRKTTQEDLVGIQKASELKPAETTLLGAAKSPELTKKLEVLEKKAIETNLKDIKTHDPELYAKIDTASIKTTDQIQAATVKTLMETAPKAPPKRKPFKSELDDLEQGAYEKYFKIVE